MKINRSNYEIWLIDWLDGNLSDLQVEQVLLFLYQNPDLQKDFEDLSYFSLKPSEKSFPGKSLLKKTTSELSEKQFEFLCVASMENDLNSSQEAELKEIIALNPTKGKTLEFIQKMKLVPEDVRYEHKNQLVKKTIAQRIIKFSIIGLSTAAAIALLIVVYQLIPRNQLVNSKEGMISFSSQETKDTSLSFTQKNSKDGMHSVSSNNVVTRSNLSPTRQEQKPGKTLAVVPEENTIIQESLSLVQLSNDPVLRSPEEVTKINKIQISSHPGFPGINLNNTLIATNITHISQSSDEDRSNVGRFIAKNFREIFLKEKNPKNNPLKGYEIAEAGVTGLNKLLGWEMALEKNNDENGELRSVYFSSKILKFNAPVKKSEP
jgi:hypothetical protein